MESKRIGSIDILKVIAMFMIVVLHLLGKGGILYNTSPKSFEWFSFSFVEGLAIVAVNIFAICSGFLNTNRVIKLRTIFYLYLQVFFYSVVITLIIYILKKDAVSSEEIIRSFFPITFRRYWYFSSFVLVFLAMPLLNIIITKIKDKALLFYLIIGGVLFCIINYHLDVFRLNSGYSSLWLMYLYLVGGYLKNNLDRIRKIKGCYLFLILYIVAILLNVAYAFYISKINDYKKVPISLEYNFIFNFIASLCLVFFFLIRDYKSNKLLTFFSNHSFGVYLIHTHPLVFNLYLVNLLKEYLSYNFVTCLLIVIGVAVIIYLSCTLIDYLRAKLFDLLRINRLLGKVTITSEELIKKELNNENDCKSK